MASTHYAQIVDPRVAQLVQGLSEAEREAFEEKAGIRQHLGGYSQAQGEIEALLDVLVGKVAQAESVVRVFRLAMPDGSSQWALSADLAQPLAFLREVGGSDIAEEALGDVLHRQYGGLAFLATSA